MAAADKKDQFRFTRPPRVVSFMRMLERCGKWLTAEEPPLVLVTLGRGVELGYEAMAGPHPLGRLDGCIRADKGLLVNSVLAGRQLERTPQNSFFMVVAL